MSNFLEYSNANHVNIIPKQEFEDLVQEVFNVISTNLSKSLGPLGSSATILDGMLTEATKDGYSILKKYCFHNRYKKMIYNLILAPCTRMNNTVGDGTTTAIALTSALFNRYKSSEYYIDTLYRLPRQFNKAWDDVIEDITNRVKEMATPIDPEDYQTIYNIAYVTSNGNHEISDSIARIYSEAKSPSIKQKDSPTNKSYISPINGFDFPANLISDAFVRNEDLSATENDLYVMIFDHKIETDFFKDVIVPINNVMRARGNKLLIVAPFYDAYMCETVVDQYITYEFVNHGGNNLILAQYELGKLEKYQLVDFATVLKAKVITQELANTLTNYFTNGDVDTAIENMLVDPTFNMYRFIGNAAEAMLSCTTGSIFKVVDIENDEKYQDALRHARVELENIISQTDYEKQSYAHKIYTAKARISQLEMKNFIYYIGADSVLQKQIIWDSVEDVIKCVRSAIKSGSVPGCQLSIIKAGNDIITDIDKKYKSNEDGHPEEIVLSTEDKLKISIVTIIMKSVSDVYYHILHGPDGMGMIKLLPRWQFTDRSNEEAVKNLREEAIEKSQDIIKESIETNTTFDMETLEFNPNIITSAETDTMVLSAASELVKILISGNQCIFLDSDINNSHNETVEAYV